MRLDLRSLPILLVLGCGGGDKTTDSTTMPGDTTAAEPAATEMPAPGATQPTPPAETKPEPKPVPDGPTAGPDIYKSVFEDDKVRVFEVTFAPGAKIALHQHPDHVVYVVKPGKLKVAVPEEEAKEHDLKAGDAVFFPAQMHEAENTGTTEVKVAVVELKAGATFEAAPKGGDPVKVGKANYKKVFENDRVRVLTVTFKKGQSIKDHAHPYHVVYILEGGKLKITAGKEKPAEMEAQPGQAFAIPAQVHNAKNTGKTQVKAVVFEIKGEAAADGGAAPAEPTK